MNHEEVGRYWNGNAATWTRLVRAGFDVYRDHLNTPAFMEMLPDVRGQSGLDIGCGEGYNTRLLAQTGASMTAVDIAETFVEHAREHEAREPLGIEYHLASAVALPFPDATFDFATGFMSFMDIPETAMVLSEAHRVIRRGGFLQFSICHPCFDTPHRVNLRDAEGRTYALEVGDYFSDRDGEIEEWLFGAAPDELRAELPNFRIPRFTSTLSHWVNQVIEAGFVVERLEEPRPDDEVVRECHHVQDAQVVAYFLLIRARKPAGEVHA